MAQKAFHGGDSFSVIGDDFSNISKTKKVINADVLDAWFDPSPKAIKKIRRYLAYSLKTSPPTYCKGLIKTISKYRKITVNNIVVGGGSSDLLFTLFPMLIKQGDKVLILDPMYGEYQHILEKVIKAKVIRYKLEKENEFEINSEKLIKEVKKTKPKLVVVVNPNSPTGKYLEKKKLLKILRTVPKNVLMVIDETYIEYIGKKSSLEKEIKRHKNLVVLKSMSKVYALSGARAGYFVADKKIADKISPFVPPWSISMIGQIAAIEALNDEKYHKKKYKETHRLRKEIIKKLQAIKTIKVYDAVANYFLVELKDKKLKADKIIQKLKKKNIFLRNCDSMSQQFKNNFIRVTVKDRKTNNLIVKALKEIVE